MERPLRAKKVKLIWGLTQTSAGRSWYLLKKHQREENNQRKLGVWGGREVNLATILSIEIIPR